MLSWLAMMTLLPGRAPGAGGPPPRPAARGTTSRARTSWSGSEVPVLERVTRYPVAVLTVAGVVTVASLWALPSVAFDYNLLNLQAKGTESVTWEQAHPRHRRPLGLQRLWPPRTRWRSCGRAQTRSRSSAHRVRGGVRARSSSPTIRTEKIAIIETSRPARGAGADRPPSPVDLEQLTRAVAGPQSAGSGRCAARGGGAHASSRP